MYDKNYIAKHLIKYLKILTVGIYVKIFTNTEELQFQ